MKKYAVIVAGGSGSRMGNAVPKQFLLLRGKPVLWYSLEVFLGAYADMEIILVVSEEYMEEARSLIATTTAPSRIRLVAGGLTRFHSVRNGLGVIGGEDSVIFVQHGVRCLLSPALGQRCYEQAIPSASTSPVGDFEGSLRLGT